MHQQEGFTSMAPVRACTACAPASACGMCTVRGRSLALTPREGGPVQLAVRGPFGLFDAIREYASKARLRYKMNGFNLDLRYITPNIIVMATPADRGVLDPAARNHIIEVNRFFNTYHKGFVKYYNLVGELGKFVCDTHKLDATIVHDFAFLDHEVPGLSRMQSFCSDVKVWLQMNAQNVVVIMCRSGRNRSAVMACGYLLFAWPAEFQTASDAHRGRPSRHRRRR